MHLDTGEILLGRKHYGTTFPAAETRALRELLGREKLLERLKETFPSCVTRAVYGLCIHLPILCWQRREMIEITECWDLVRYKAPGHDTRLHTVHLHSAHTALPRVTLRTQDRTELLTKGTPSEQKLVKESFDDVSGRVGRITLWRPLHAIEEEAHSVIAVFRASHSAPEWRNLDYRPVLVILRHESLSLSL